MHATDEIFPTGGEPAVLEITARKGGHAGTICLVLPDEEAPRRQQPCGPATRSIPFQPVPVSDRARSR